MDGKKLRFAGMLSKNKKGEVWVQDPVSGSYHQMDEVGERICRLLKTPMAHDKLVALLVQEYEVDAAQCARDIAPFLEKLIVCGLLKEEKA